MVIRRAASVLIVVLGIAALLTGCTDENGKGVAREEAATAAGGQLFVASAAKGALRPEGQHEFTLTLGEANDSVGVFTDRPERKAGTESLAAFVDAWDDRGFAESPPNAAVVWGKDSTSRVFELSDPSFDSAADTITFTAQDLGDEPSTALSSFTGTSDAELPEDLGEVSVFIDDATGGSSGGQFFFQGPADSTGTITIADQTLYSASFSVAQGRGGGRQSSPTQMDVACENTCYIFISFTLSPGTWPVKGSVEVSSGAVFARASGGAAIKMSPGDFSFDEDGK